MSVLDQVLWWTGATTWTFLGLIGLLWTIDQSLEWVIRGFNFRREFMAFCVDRIKRRMARI